MFRTTGSAWQQLVVSTVACWTITTNGTRSQNSTKLLFSQVAACAYICEMTHGYENEVVPFIGIHLANPLCLPEVSWPDSLHAWQWGPGTISTGFENTWDWHTHQQQDGPCKGEDTDAVTNVQTMDDIKGDWWDADVCKRGVKQGFWYRWVLWGVNCGEAPYPGGYDWYPCQHERFIQQVEWW